jgi:hypothetical protein
VSIRLTTTCLLTAALLAIATVDRVSPARAVRDPNHRVQTVSESRQPGALGSQAASLDLVAQAGGASYAIAVEGSLAYVDVGPRLMVMDVTDAAHPRLLGQTGVLPGLVGDIALSGGYAFLAAGAEALLVVDVRDPARPRLVTQYGDGAWFNGIVTAGHYAYVSGYSGAMIYSLRVIDIADPTAPREVGATNVPTALDVDVVGDHAYTVGSRALYILDVSDVASPQLVASYDVPNAYVVLGLSVGDGHAYLADMLSGLHVIDVRDPTRPQSVALLASARGGIHVDVAAGRAYMATFDGLTVVDVGVPAAPVLRGSLASRSGMVNLRTVGDRVYASTGQDGLSIVDATNPDQPHEIGGYETFGLVRTVRVADGHAFMAASLDLRVADVTDPANPRLLVKLDVPGSIDSLDLAGHYVYAANGADGLATIDVSDPVVPRLIAALDTPDFAGDIDAQGNRAYVADDSRLLAIDIADPTLPRVLGSCAAGQTAHAVAANGNYAYVAAFEDGLRVVDVRNGAAPREVGVYDPEGAVYDAAVAGNLAVVAAKEDGLRVVDVSNPVTPREIGSLHTAADAYAVALTDGLAFVAEWEGSLRAVDMSRPDAPREAAAHPFAGYPEDIEVAGDLIYLSSAEGGLWVFRYNPPAATTATPSPSATATATATPPVTISPPLGRIYLPLAELDRGGQVALALAPHRVKRADHVGCATPVIGDVTTRRVTGTACAQPACGGILAP